MTEHNDFTGAELDEPLVDDLLDETRRPDDAPADEAPADDASPADVSPDESKEQPDPPTTSDVPEPPD